MFDRQRFVSWTRRQRCRRSCVQGRSRYPGPMGNLIPTAAGRGALFAKGPELLSRYFHAVANRVLGPIATAVELSKVGAV